jgi:hypothetical protein
MEPRVWMAFYSLANVISLGLVATIGFAENAALARRDRGWALLRVVVHGPRRPPRNVTLCYAFCRGFAVCMSNMGRPEAVYSWGRNRTSAVCEDNRNESKDVAQRNIPLRGSSTFWKSNARVAIERETLILGSLGFKPAPHSPARARVMDRSGAVGRRAQRSGARRPCPPLPSRRKALPGAVLGLPGLSRRLGRA